jgi:hypothetical protein
LFCCKDLKYNNLMMKRIIFAFCVVASVLSCAKQGESASEPSGRTVTLSARCDAADSKVMLNSLLKTVWNNGDPVSVFYNGSTGNAKGLFTGSDGAAEGDITVQVAAELAEGEISGTTYAAIPYRETNHMSGQVLYGSIPAVQYYKDGSYDPEGVLLVASTPSTSLTFRYACAVLSLEVKAGGSLPLTISSITLSAAAGEAIAGNVAVDMQNPSQPALSLEGTGSSSIELRPAASAASLCTIAAGSSARFYFCAAPVALAQGYVFNVHLSGDETVLVRNTAAKQLEMAGLLGIECSISPSVAIIIDFDTAFSPALPTSATTPPESGAIHTFTNAASSGGQYSITAYSKYYAPTVSGQKCFRFNDSGSCLLLPSIPGMRLRSMKAKILTNSGSKPMSVASTKGSSAGDIVPRTDFLNDELISAVAYGTTDAPLYLYTHSVNTQIESIELYFE